MNATMGAQRTTATNIDEIREQLKRIADALEGKSVLSAKDSVELAERRAYDKINRYVDKWWLLEGA